MVEAYLRTASLSRMHKVGFSCTVCRACWALFILFFASLTLSEMLEKWVILKSFNSYFSFLSLQHSWYIGQPLEFWSHTFFTKGMNSSWSIHISKNLNGFFMFWSLPVTFTTIGEWSDIPKGKNLSSEIERTTSPKEVNNKICAAYVDPYCDAFPSSDWRENMSGDST